jgi:hypothetical protein
MAVLWRDIRSPAQQRAEQVAVDTATFFDGDDPDDNRTAALAHWYDHQDLILAHNGSVNDRRFVVGSHRLLGLGWIHIAAKDLEAEKYAD